MTVSISHKQGTITVQGLECQLVFKSYFQEVLSLSHDKVEAFEMITMLSTDDYSSNQCLRCLNTLEQYNVSLITLAQVDVINSISDRINQTDVRVSININMELLNNRRFVEELVKKKQSKIALEINELDIYKINASTLSNTQYLANNDVEIWLDHYCNKGVPSNALFYFKWHCVKVDAGFSVSTNKRNDAVEALCQLVAACRINRVVFEELDHTAKFRVDNKMNLNLQSYSCCKTYDFADFSKKITASIDRYHVSNIDSLEVKTSVEH